MLHLGLADVMDLDMDAKRQYLFGRNTVDDALDHDPEVGDALVMFDHYLDLKLYTPGRQKLFLPMALLNWCRQHHNQNKDAQFSTAPKTVSLFSAMHKPRYPRFLVSCWLSQQQSLKFNYTQSWEQHEHLDKLCEVLQLGYLRDWTKTWGPKLTNMPKNFFGGSDDMLHTELNSWKMVADLYVKAAAAAVLEPVFWEQGCIITEKYLQAVLGGCIPLVNGYRVYDCLAALGFDTFNDVIDTSSQHETNPVLAAWNMLEKNRDFLQNALDISHDRGIQERLRENFELARNRAKIFKNSLLHLNTPYAQEFFMTNRSEILEAFRWQGEHIDIFYDITI